MDEATIDRATTPTIIYTKVDEAPALATYAFLPTIEAFAGAAGVSVETRDISLAGRIVAAFRDALTPQQRVDDDLAYLGELAQTPQANIIKLPNISASLPQLKAAIRGTAGEGLRAARLPRRPRERRGARGARTLRPGQGQRGQPRPPARELGPARPGFGQGLRTRTPAPDGGVDPRSRASHVATMAVGRLPLERESPVTVSSAEAGDARIELGRRRRRAAGAEGVGPAGSRRRHRRQRDEPQQLCAPSSSEQVEDARATGRPLLAAPQGDDDEGLGPDHLRARGGGVLRDRVRAARRRRSSGWASNPDDGLGELHAKLGAPERSGAGASRDRHRGYVRPAAGRWRWWTRTRGSPTCTSPAT
jgi:hypothetical protein